MDFLKKIKLENRQNLAWPLFGLVFLLISRLLPLIKAPLSAFGYDYGFYYYAASNPTQGWRSVLTGFSGGFDNSIFHIFKFFHIPPEISLSLSYLIFSVFLGLSLYWFFIPKNRTVGIIAVFLYSISMVQMESYLMFLYKNAFALPFLILGYKYLMAKRWQPFVFCTAAILFIHRTTAIIYLLAIGFYSIWMMIKNKKWKLLTSLGAIFGLLFAACYFLLPLKSIIFNLIKNNNYLVRTGLFLPYNNPLALIWPMLILAMLGVFIYIKQKENILPFLFSIICILWIMFNLPFYRRIWIYFDLSLIIFASYFLSAAISKNKLPKSAVIVIIIVMIVFSSYRFINFTIAHKPLIIQSEIQELKNFNPASGMVLAVSANDAPWILAYVHSQRLGAPGLLEDPHTYQEWQDFWQGLHQREFIAKYPRPLYFYQRDWQLPPMGIALCLKPISKNFSEVNFACIEKKLGHTE